MTDRTTKILLFAIAVGLWAQLVTAWLTPTPVAAQYDVSGALSSIDSQVSRIARGTCVNSKIC